MFWNFYLVKIDKIANNSVTTQGREKNEHIFEIIRILKLFDACLTKFENYQILLHKISHRYHATTKLFCGWKSLIGKVSVKMPAYDSDRDRTWECAS